MGDGRVALILDVMRLAQRASILSEGRDRTAAESSGSGTASNHDRQTLLLVGLGEKQQLAIPLEMVARLEEIPQDKIEWAAGREVVQYRGVIMPIIRLSQIFDSQGSADGKPVDPMPVVVYSKNGRSVGLAVDRVIDIVEEEIKILANTTREGILRSAVVHNRVTDFLDVHGIIRKSEPAFFAEENPQPQGTEETLEPEMEGA